MDRVPSPPHIPIQPVLSSSTCLRCQDPVGSEDRYCRSCGYALHGRLDYVQDLNRAIVEGVPMGIFSIDLSSRVRYWNAAMETHTGLKRRDVLGRLLFDSLPYLQPFTGSGSWRGRCSNRAASSQW